MVPMNKLEKKIQIRVKIPLEVIVSVSHANNCVSFGNNHACDTCDQSCQRHLGTIVPVSLGSNRGSFTWKQQRQCHLGTIVPLSLGNYSASVTYEQSCQCHLRTVVLVSLGNICSSFTWEQSYQSHLRTIVADSELILETFCVQNLHVMLFFYFFLVIFTHQKL